MPVRDVPPLARLQAVARVVAVPMVTRFRGLTTREAMLFDGPSGWGEFAPFVEYPPAEAARWLAAAVEAAWGRWPAPLRASVRVNAIVPAVDPGEAARLVRDSRGCRTAKVKVAERGHSLDEDIARVVAVAAALAEAGTGGRVRVDANGAWTVAEAVTAVPELVAACGGPDAFEYAEQPCATLAEQAEVRRRVDVRLAVDEGVRKAADPRHVAGLREAADILVLKVAPLGGVAAALHIAAAYGLPVVVSSALDTSVGLAAGVAMAAALPELDLACGLGSGRLLARDVVGAATRLLPVDGALAVTRPVPDPGLLDELVVGPERERWWRSRLDAAYEIMAAR
jgi:O-succinylbenzoate synthase